MSTTFFGALAVFMRELGFETGKKGDCKGCDGCNSAPSEAILFGSNTVISANREKSCPLNVRICLIAFAISSFAATFINRCAAVIHAMTPWKILGGPLSHSLRERFQSRELPGGIRRRVGCREFP